MNRADFQQTGGFPLETNTLEFMQAAYGIFNAFGALAGNNTIISGCETEGANITDGHVYVNGELLPFKGGTQQASVVIVETKQEVEFENGEIKEVYADRYATFGISGNSIAWADFKRYYPNQPIVKEIKWVGRNVTKNDLPRGWFIADGTNGTDNVLGRMIVGKDTSAEFNQVGKSGGEKTHTLTVDEMPSHKHTGSTSNSGQHRHGFRDGYFAEGTSTSKPASGSEYQGKQVRGSNDTDADNDWIDYKDRNTELEGGHYHSLNLNNTGSNQPHNNLPPYIVMIPIQFIGG